MEAHAQQKLLSILSFWHKIEFFIPFDLESQLNEAEQGQVKRYYPSSLVASNHIWKTTIPSGFELTNFYLYLGGFDKSELVKVCSKVTSSEAVGLNQFAERERTALEGLTCFARLNISSTGELPPDSDPNAISVSTLPWALGQLLRDGLSGLSHVGFRQARDQLGAEIQNFSAEREPGPLQPSELSRLHHLFCQWASFWPSDQKPTAIIEACLRKKKKQIVVEAPNVNTSQPDVTQEENDDDEPEPRVGILNSFFIQDIERAMEDVSRGNIPRALESYLSPLSPEHRIELESERGLQAVLDALHPSRINRGRWFTDIRRPMGLMQQFAINTALPDSDPPALFSVNGPPGTGKTTLLRDIIAELVVRRARVLSQLKDAKSAFEPVPFPARFEGKANTVRMMRLKRELTGFEMVVASSNNRAVENVSSEFLKAGPSIAEGWSSVSYLRSVARKIAAQKDNGKFRTFEPGDEPWGLIACKLGKSANRYAFKEKFAFNKLTKDEQQTFSPDPSVQTIYQWIDGYRGPSFAEAAAAFKKIEEAIAQELVPLEAAAAILRRKLDDPNLSETLDRLIGEFHAEKERLAIDLQTVMAKRATLKLDLVQLREDERLIERTYPGWWAALRRIPAASAYKAAKRENARLQINVRRELAGLKAHHNAVNAQLNTAVHRLQQAESQKQEAEVDSEALQKIFPAAQSLHSLAGLNHDCFQKEGLWHTEALAQLRSSLFSAALALHEAWLAEVAKKNGLGGAGFRANIVAIITLLSNKIPEQPEVALATWQSLFMIVPVVSTTFASFANQFRNIPAESLGWVFIDEAGQAVPQAAVGALWRSQHAIVVGDPLQIEPVFTLPSRFISALAGLSPETAGGEYSPHRTSVQRLADRANRYGTSFNDQSGMPLWVGSPLRVHRRCIDPMFSWANEISYNNKMVYGLAESVKPNGPPIASESVWIELKGGATIRQAVPQQTQFVAALLLGLFRRDGRLPNLYIISPFKAVKNSITKSLLELDWTSGPIRPELRKWCRANIGTVHTLQGKEEDSVLMVLGADQDHRKAAEWAASEPNLLNVALTRAKRRFYIVGDRQLWGEMGPFRWANGRLASVGAQEFLSLIHEQSAPKIAAQSG